MDQEEIKKTVAHAAAARGDLETELENIGDPKAVSLAIIGASLRAAMDEARETGNEDYLAGLMEKGAATLRREREPSGDRGNAPGGSGGSSDSGDRGDRGNANPAESREDDGRGQSNDNGDRGTGEREAAPSGQKPGRAGSSGSSGPDSSDLKAREYRDEDGTVHHHTKAYMERHKED